MQAHDRLATLVAIAALTAALAQPSFANRNSPPNPSSNPSSTATPVATEIPLADADAAAVHVVSAPDAWGGQRSGREATLSDRVVNYDIDARLDPVHHTVDGHELLTWRNRSDRPVKSVYLHLYLNAFEGENSTFYSEHRETGFQFRSDVPTHDGEWGHIALNHVAQNGSEVHWSFVHPDGGPATDHTVVRFDLPTAVPAHGETTLDIRFIDQLPRVIARTGYWGTFHLVGQWFPKIAVLELPGERGATAPRWNAHEFHLFSEFYADYGRFDVRITVPSDFTVGAVGEETGDPVSHDGLTTHRFVQADVHDFAFTADNQSGPTLVGTYHGAGSPEVTVRVIYPKEYQASAAPALKATIDSLTYFSNTLGPYPYRTVTVVVPPYNAAEAGGMEYPTFFTAEGYAKVPEETITQDDLDFVTIHEFGHGYFYGILGSNEFEEPMLDEGLNEYWDFHMLRAAQRVAHVVPAWLKATGFHPTVEYFAYARAGAMLEDPKDPLGGNSWDRHSSAGYVSVYDRTATTLHDLEQRLGQPVMEAAFKEYYSRWKFRHPGIADFEAAIADVSGKPELVHRAFAEQVYATHPVDDSIESLSSDEDLPRRGTHEVDGRWVEQTQDQVSEEIEKTRRDWAHAHPNARENEGPYNWRTTVMLARHGAAAKQKIVVHFADGSSETAYWDDHERWARFTWVKPARAVSAELDPDHVQLLDANLLNNTRTIDPNHAPSLRWSSDLAHFVNSMLAILYSL